MSFRPRRALAVFWKDSLDLLINRGLLLSMLVMPVVFVLVPAGIIYAYARDPTDSSLRAMAAFYEPGFSGANAARFLIDKTLTDWFGLYLAMPVFVPILIPSQSVAGEKERRTLEPLLASPVTAAELLLGKSLAALVPAYVISIIAYAALSLLVDVAAWPHVHAFLLPNRLWTVGVLVIAPLYAFLGNGVAVVISARVAEARLAQQLSALIVLPVVGVVAGQVAGFFKAGPVFYGVQALVVLAVDACLVWVGVRLFDRERLVSRWG